MKFKVGDRVRVYGANTQSMELVGTVLGLNFHNYPEVRPDKNPNSSYVFHPKQCRRLKKKQRRRVWATQHMQNGLWSVLYTEPPCSLQIDKDWEIVEFIEVRKKGGTQ